MTASNATLNEILGMEKGPASIKSLAWMMFGGLDDGAKITVEPLLNEDVTIDVGKNSALITVSFGVQAPEKLHQWTSKDMREFDNLEQALAEAEKAMEMHGAEVLQKAVSENTAQGKAQRKMAKRKLKKKKKPRSPHDRWRQRGTGRKKEKDDPFTTFVRAAKFVRCMGAGTIHPSAKLRLFGLLMQAQRGNVRKGDQAQSIDLLGLKGSALALQRLKLKAWRSQKDKSREDAMEEYVELVTSLAPQWKVAHFLAGRESAEDDKPRPRQMMWVLKVNYRQTKEEDKSKLGQRIDPTRGRRVTSIEVLQSSNATSARLWVEEQIAEKTKKAATDSASGELGGKGEEEQEEFDEDPFIANIPKEEEWSLSDCIVDRSKFKTIEDQRAYFQKRMRKMARAGRDKEDGWAFYCMTKVPAVPESEQYVRERGRERGGGGGERAKQDPSLPSSRPCYQLTLHVIEPIATLIGCRSTSATCHGPRSSR